MRNFIASLLRFRPIMIVLLAAWLLGGGYMFSISISRLIRIHRPRWSR